MNALHSRASSRNLLDAAGNLLEMLMRVPRPYEQRYVTDGYNLAYFIAMHIKASCTCSGVNRVTAMIFHHKLESISKPLTRFSASQIETLITELEVIFC